MWWDNKGYSKRTLLFLCCWQHSEPGVHDAPHAHETSVVHAHVHEVPVLSGPHIHHPAFVAGLFIQQPMSINHMTGHAPGHAETVHDVVTVVHQLMHLAFEVLPLRDLNPEGAVVLEHTNNQQSVWVQYHTFTVSCIMWLIQCFAVIGHVVTLGIMRQDLMQSLIPIMLM